jgi:cytochrome P450
MAVDVPNLNLAELDFFSPEVLADPYEVLALLRARHPVFQFRQPTYQRDPFVFSTYELVDKVLRDNKNFSSHTNEMLTGGGKGNPEAEAIYATEWPEVDTLLTADEPDHGRLRAFAVKAFMPGRIKRMASLIEETITSLIDGFIERGECDFVREFAIPLPVNSIGAVLGIERSYYQKLYEWTFSMMRRNGQLGSAADQVFDAHKVVEMKQFVSKLVAERRAAPGDDLISDLVTAEVAGVSPFTDLELLSTVMILIVGGADTTRSSLISCIARLCQHPDQLRLVRQDLSLIPAAIDEVLRLDTPVSALWRIAKHDVDVGGTKIPAGAVVMVRIDSANRDANVFENPDTFNILRRAPKTALTFGAGIHHCVGFRLAREQLNQSLTALLTRLGDIKLINEKCDLRTHLSVQTRCLRELHISFTPGKRAR